MSKMKSKRPGLSIPRKVIKHEELKTILEKTKPALTGDDYEKLKAAVDTLAFITQELESKGVTIDRLRRYMWGPSTEKTSQVLGESAGADGKASAPAQAKVRAPGHGRNGAAAYRGAKKVQVPHAELHRGDACPECIKGRLYPLAMPAVLVRVQGMAPLGATVYECDRLRCNLCQEIFTAEAPTGDLGSTPHSRPRTVPPAVHPFPDRVAPHCAAGRVSVESHPQGIVEGNRAVLRRTGCGKCRNHGNSGLV